MPPTPKLVPPTSEAVTSPGGIDHPYLGDPVAVVEDTLARVREFADRRKDFAPSPRFQLLNDDELVQLPDAAWLIERMLPTNGLIALIGAPKSYKSFVALDWACHIALGLDWYGRPVQQGAVVYVYAEGVSGLCKRVAAWKTYAGLDNPLGVLFLPHPISLNEEGDARDLVAAIEHRLPGETPALVIIDTLNRNLAGNENSSEHMGAFVRGCDLVRVATGAAVLVVHHKGYGADDRGRGSSVFEAAADCVILCTRDDDRLNLECKWMKDEEDGWGLAMESLPIAGSLVLRPSGPRDGELKGQRLLCLRALHDDYTEHGAAHKSWMESTGIKAKSSFDKARSWLQAQAYVRSDNGRWKITDAGHLALNENRSTQSTGGAPWASGPGFNPVHPAGGIRSTPAVDLKR